MGMKNRDKEVKIEKVRRGLFFNFKDWLPKVFLLSGLNQTERNTMKLKRLWGLAGSCSPIFSLLHTTPESLSSGQLCTVPTYFDPWVLFNLLRPLHPSRCNWCCHSTYLSTWQCVTWYCELFVFSSSLAKQHITKVQPYVGLESITQSWDTPCIDMYFRLLSHRRP